MSQLIKNNCRRVTAPLLSVCIPVFNCDKFIGEAIQSVLQQTYANYELIILDNCSTDKTVDVARKFCDVRMRIIQNEENIGAESNFNKCFLEARGEYLKILCADDTLYPDCLERQIAPFMGPDGSKIAMVCCGRDIIDEFGNIVFRRRFGRREEIVAGRNAVQKCVRRGANNIGEPSAVLLSMRFVEQAGRFDISIPYVIDLDLWCRILLKGNLYVIPTALCTFRIFSESWSVQSIKSQAIDYRKLIDKLMASRRYELGNMDVILGRLMASASKNARKALYHNSSRRLFRVIARLLRCLMSLHL